jgi:RNA polymerase-binding transcription factor DksA
MTATTVARPRVLSAAGQLRRIRRALHEQRADRIAQVADLESRHVTAEEPPEPAQVQTLVRNARHAVSEIDAALERIMNGRYGVCTVCKQAIAWQRLEALPAAARCMPCQRAREYRQR